MSRGLNEFVRNFLAGAQLGSHFVDQHEQRQHRKQMLEATIARNAQAAAAAKERMANERERTRLYGIGVEAKAARDRAKAAGGGAAGPPAGLDEWAAKHVPDYAGPPTPTPITMTVNTESNDSVAAPPSYGSDGAGDGDGAIVQARGGIARKIVQGFGAGAAAGRRALDTRYPGTPPFNPNAQTGGAGTTGPGSGMGQ